MTCRGRGYVSKVGGYLEVGTNDRGEVVVNHPDLKPDADGCGHIVFSPEQARAFAKSLITKAADADAYWATRKAVKP